MSREVAGVPLADLEEPIHDALTVYRQIAGGSIEFDETARTLELTPDKPNSARSVTKVKHLGETIGNLYVIAFAPNDGTGDTSVYDPEYTAMSGGLRSQAQLMPRSKQGTHSELHLALGAKYAEWDTDISPFAGQLELIGFKDDGSVGIIGRLGQYPSEFLSALESGVFVEPTASLTVGEDDITGERVGDPHAVYNLYGSIVQVAGFVAISNEMAEQHAIIAKELSAELRK